MDKIDRFEAANRKAEELRASLPRAVRARYDRRIGRVVITLSTNLEVAFAPRDAEGLEGASPAQSPAKAAAAKQNGRAGGRPRKREAAA